MTANLIVYGFLLIASGLISWFTVWWLLLLLGRSNSISKKDYYLLLGSLWIINFLSVSSTMLALTSKTVERFMNPNKGLEYSLIELETISRNKCNQ